jgi:hypothetical protein
MTNPRPPGEPRRFALVAASVDVRARVQRLAGWALLFSLVVMVPLAIAVTGFLVFVPLAAALVWLTMMLLPRLRSVGPRPGVLEIEGSALTLTVNVTRGEPVRYLVQVADLVRGFRTDDEVRLETRSGVSLALGIDDAATGEAVLGALGLDARQRVLSVSLPCIASRVPGAATFAWIIGVLQAPGVLLLPLGVLQVLFGGTRSEGSVYVLGFGLVEVLILSLTLRVLLRRPVAIGMDGIVFRRFLRRRFYPYRAIADVTLVHGGVTLALRSGRQVRLRTTGFWSRSGFDDDARALFERVETARAAASGHDVQAKLPLLERRGRSAADWRAHLSALVGKAGYRSGAVTVRDLAAVIDDAGLEAEYRVAATLALAAAEPEEARARGRIAAAACADGELRAALDHAAEGELDEAKLDRLVARGR